MGDIADMVLEGILCQVCGGYIHGGGEGYPQTCSDCREPKKKKKKKSNENTHIKRKQ